LVLEEQPLQLRQTLLEQMEQILFLALLHQSVVVVVRQREIIVRLVLLAVQAVVVALTLTQMKAQELQTKVMLVAQKVSVDILLVAVEEPEALAVLV
jgi:hypothetical protein